MSFKNIIRHGRLPLSLCAALLLVLLALSVDVSAQQTSTTLTQEPTTMPIEEDPPPPPDSDPTPMPTPTPTPAPTTTAGCERTIKADVVAFDQVITYNRLGAVNPSGMMYALRRDVKAVDTTRGLVAGNVTLKPYKRPRPLVLRMNVGDCLQIIFQNLLSSSPKDDNQPATRTASAHVIGLQLVNGISDDGSNVGNNVSSLVGPGGSMTYTYFAEREGNHLLYSTAATTGGEGDGGSLPMGLFGSVNVEPRGSEWYRSQLTEKDMALAAKKDAAGVAMKTAGGQPILDYDATYPSGAGRLTGTPILKILDANFNIVHSDLNAIITGANKGRFPAGTYPKVATEPDRDQPFREFTVVYHDEIKAVQAFPEFFEDPVLGHTLHSVRDAFAINYGTAGVGSEILANRLKVGPMYDCTECLYEEFFLSSWAIGDPAQLVDVPANTTDAVTGALKTGPKATKVLFPEDPSNVHHSYMNDHVKMRVVHAGPKEHHIHHLHAHQWLRTPDSDNSSYLDSQALGPGYSFTTEIAHGGSGNRNNTVGDSIFHCHFYPHFAQGMWELWRVHDVFEAGTKLDTVGRPAAGSRALPDGEIAVGSPIPAIVPVPTIAMPPMPGATAQIVGGQVQVTGTGNPGYPFFVPAKAGHRPPTPPMDVVDDGGLPRHIITGGTYTETHDRLNFDKVLLTAAASAIPEAGTTLEKAAMTFHSTRNHASYTPDGSTTLWDGTVANFVTNGRPAVKGAPFADPCVNDSGLAAGVARTYKGANIQLDMKINKVGWHVPQARISVLWEDVAATRSGTRAPEPLFFRANTNDCITFHHTNLVPRVYEQDDFQVRTPTDIMGQHIHLVKFDVMASDGAGNGFNYEDGTFSPEEVIERIHAIRKYNGCTGLDSGDTRDGTFTCPVAKAHPFFGTLGAQTTIQRWYVDNTLNNAGVDRTLRTVFTHDHFGPSTHQQTGLYAGLVVEPQGSKWRHPETGAYFGGAGVVSRADGGPTSWRADIITSNTANSYREFLLEFADFQLAYTKDGVPVNPPAKDEVGLPYLVQPATQCPGGVPLPCPEAVSAADPGTMSVNYRNEPVALRVRNPATNTQTAGEAGDLSHVYRSLTTRADAALNTQPTFYPALTADVQPGDPYTPILRAYEDDPVQVRVLVGAHEEGHNFSMHGIKWKFEPSDENSGYRGNQMMGISEHYEFIVPKLPRKFDGKTADYLYQPGASVDDQWNGLWGLMRVYGTKKADLLELPNNLKNGVLGYSNQGDFNGVCPKTAPVRNFNVTAISAKSGLSAGTLVYNSRTTNGGKLHDPTAIMFVRSSDIDATTNKLKAGVPIEPLVLRALPGECLQVTLKNGLPTTGAIDLNGFNTLPMIVKNFNANQVKPSSQVGLHPQNVFYDVTTSNGVNVGLNPVQTAAPGGTVSYQWYTGDVTTSSTGAGVATPIEFGATNLTSSDPIKHSNKGAIGALIIEPANSTWTEDASSRAQATVTVGGTSFREFVMMFQNDINMRYDGMGATTSTVNGIAVPNLAEEEDAEDSGQKAVNYRSEPLWKRMGFAPDTHLSQGDDNPSGISTRDYDYTDVLSNSKVGGDPVTPVFTATAGQAVRVRLLQPAGHARNNVFTLHGHIWEEEPYTNSSNVIGTNTRSEWKGAQYGIGPGSHFDLLLKNGAGGKFGVEGDYLYRTFASSQFSGGIWGIFRVGYAVYEVEPYPTDPCGPQPASSSTPTTSTPTASTTPVIAPCY